MNEYLSYFLDEKQVVDALDFPDDGIEYAYMLQKEDLDYLLDVWDKYSKNGGLEYHTLQDVRHLQII